MLMIPPTCKECGVVVPRESWWIVYPPPGTLATGRHFCSVDCLVLGAEEMAAEETEKEGANT